MLTTLSPSPILLPFSPFLSLHWRKYAQLLFLWNTNSNVLWFPQSKSQPYSKEEWTVYCPQLLLCTSLNPQNSKNKGFSSQRFTIVTMTFQWLSKAISILQCSFQKVIFKVYLKSPLEKLFQFSIEQMTTFLKCLTLLHSFQLSI